MNFWETRKLNPKTRLRMLTITLPRGIDSGLTQIVRKEMTHCVEVLGPKFGFPVDEELEALLASDVKFVKKRGPIPKVGKGGKPKKVKSASEMKGASGYLLFSSAIRGDVRSELESVLESGKKLLPQVVIKELAIRWKALEQEERDEWNYSAKEVEPPPVRQNAQDNFTFDNPPPLLQATRQRHEDPRFTQEWADDLLPEVLEKEPKPARVPAPVQVSDSESDDEDEVRVEKFEINGTIYLKDDENKLYDKDTHDPVAQWVVHSDPTKSHAEFYKE